MSNRRIIFTKKMKNQPRYQIIFSVLKTLKMTSKKYFIPLPSLFDLACSAAYQYNLKIGIPIIDENINYKQAWAVKRAKVCGKVLTWRPLVSPLRCAVKAGNHNVVEIIINKMCSMELPEHGGHSLRMVVGILGKRQKYHCFLSRFLDSVVGRMDGPGTTYPLTSYGVRLLICGGIRLGSEFVPALREIFPNFGHQYECDMRGFEGEGLDTVDNVGYIAYFDDKSEFLSQITVGNHHKRRILNQTINRTPLDKHSLPTVSEFLEIGKRLNVDPKHADVARCAFKNLEQLGREVTLKDVDCLLQLHERSRNIIIIAIPHMFKIFSVLGKKAFVGLLEKCNIDGMNLDSGWYRGYQAPEGINLTTVYAWSFLPLDVVLWLDEKMNYDFMDIDFFHLSKCFTLWLPLKKREVLSPEEIVEKVDWIYKNKIEDCQKERFLKRGINILSRYHFQPEKVVRGMIEAGLISKGEIINNPYEYLDIDKFTLGPQNVPRILNLFEEGELKEMLGNVTGNHTSKECEKCKILRYFLNKK